MPSKVMFKTVTSCETPVGVALPVLIIVLTNKHKIFNTFLFCCFVFCCFSSWWKCSIPDRHASLHGSSARYGHGSGVREVVRDTKGGRSRDR